MSGAPTIPERPSGTAPLSKAEAVTFLNETQMNLQATMRPVQPAVATVGQYRFQRSNLGSPYALIELPDRSGLVVSEPERPGKLYPAGNLLPAAVALRSFFEKGEVWQSAPDKQVWSIAVRAATEANLDGHTARKLAGAVGSALGIRAGLATATAAELI